MYVHDAYDGNLRTISANAGAPIVSLDLSADGKFFQAATAVNELHFYAVADGTMVSSPALLRDTIWASITVPLGWNVQGCWRCAKEAAGESDALADAEYPQKHKGKSTKKV